MLSTMPCNTYRSQSKIALHLAWIYGKSKIISYLIEKYPEAAQVCDNNSKLPLHYASVILLIIPQMIQQVVLAWPQSSFKFVQKWMRATQIGIKMIAKTCTKKTLRTLMTTQRKKMNTCDVSSVMFPASFH